MLSRRKLCRLGRCCEKRAAVGVCLELELNEAEKDASMGRQ